MGESGTSGATSSHLHYPDAWAPAASSSALTSRQQSTLRSHLARHSRQGNRFTACLTGTGPLQPPRLTISYCRPITCKSLSSDIWSITALATGLGRLLLNDDVTALLNRQTTLYKYYIYFYIFNFLRVRKILLVNTNKQRYPYYQPNKCRWDHTNEKVIFSDGFSYFICLQHSFINYLKTENN